MFCSASGWFGNCHDQCCCRIRQAGMGANANGPCAAIMFQLMANVYMGNCGNPTAHTCIRDQISGRAAFTSLSANPVATPPWRQANGPFETSIFHLMANVYMDNCGNPTANTCIRDHIQFPGRAAFQSLSQPSCNPAMEAGRRPL